MAHSAENGLHVDADTGCEPAGATPAPYVCCGCGTPVRLGEYKSCKCATMVAYWRDEKCPPGPRHVHIVMRDPCAWCGAIPGRAEIDGDPLCHECCTRWAKGENFTDLPAEPKDASQ